MLATFSPPLPCWREKAVWKVAAFSFTHQTLGAVAALTERLAVLGETPNAKTRDQNNKAARDAI